MSNLLWFRDLTFQVPVQYCCLQHCTLLSPPDTSTTERHFCFSPSLFILSGAISNCAPLFPNSILDTFLSRGIFQCHIFLPFHSVCGILQQDYCSDLPFPPPVNHILSELFAMTHPSWAALQSMPHSLFELHSPFAMTRLWYPWRGQYIHIHTYMYNWITMLYTRNWHNIMNQLYWNF